jgi:hypothetical protein
LADWESAMPALGSGFLPKRARKRSRSEARSEALTRSKVPSVLHFLNQL